VKAAPKLRQHFCLFLWVDRDRGIPPLEWRKAAQQVWQKVGQSSLAYQNFKVRLRY
jgi:hypothetical protein